jgi:5-hydroxyisourate hydrolase
MSAEGRLSLHVLDTARGVAGDGLFFTLSRIEGEGRVTLGRWQTDGGGRWILDQAALPVIRGVHELIFETAAYQARFGQDSFYDLIAIRFVLGDEGGHYHIPLILSPFGYSTYRGG